MDVATATIVISATGTGRETAGVDYALVAHLPEFQSSDIKAWLADHGFGAANPYVRAEVLTENHDWSRIPVDAPHLQIAATDALLRQLGVEDGVRGSLTAHPYDEGT